ncbi:Transcriptional regulatory protein YycF [Sebaldella termitidis]|jgi:DNA-binding response OmpR family regulator|uniref:Two component transcriptional regulator, winged helix family n=1 Tax=Sebaldella termitidis (strain ATCC 33386 / NCTC 11300) TaxID=526218 RepID=D1AFR9_SEBTE|nr:response regulator transcription factor [Sebaldella termitidis]ACZ07954.1 two component transcriptional regulator, winged helix family [Sebaldella termitidis ATCC 33386]MBP7978983.1 response regulator transcription factor [Sebaldella sp.]SUI23255.1 Transcriptional regulatory protein YycF [Sebaldella termitidis]
MKKKILIVEDEVNLMEVLEDTLLEENFEIFKAYEGSAAIDMFYEVNPDLVLLDINLPKKDGWTICKEIRNDSNKPIIIMTARDTELDELKGLSIGADDYITKPFSLKILTLRIKKLLKIENEDYYLYETLRFNFGTYELIIDSQNIEITKKESLFLDYIIKNKGKLLTRDMLLNEVWGYDFDGDNRVVDTLIKRTRKKLSPYGDLIKTVRGMGYMFDESKN